MKKQVLTALVVLLFLPLLAGFARVESITTEAVDDYLDRMEQAFNKRDSDMIAALIAPDARIELEQPGRDGIERMSLSRDEYRTALAGGLAQLEGYRYNVKKSVAPAIAADAKSADVRVKVVESYMFKGKRIMNETDCQYHLVLKRGRLVAASIIAKGKG